MPQYLLAGYLPENFDPSTMDEATVEGIHALKPETVHLPRDRVQTEQGTLSSGKASQK